MIQGSPEWFAVRCGCIGASSIADLLSTNKSGEAASRANLRTRLVVERLTGRPVETYTNAAMQWGIDTEAEARAAYEAATGVLVGEVGWVPHPSIAWAGCSPDGLVGEEGLVEIKCPQPATHLATLLARKPAAKYLPQVQWQMACTGRQWCDLVSYQPTFPEHLRLVVHRVERDVDYLITVEVEVVEMLREVEKIIEELEGPK